MEFRWDPEKAQSNEKKHGVKFVDAVGIFNDPCAIGLPDESSGEKRIIATGIDAMARAVVVVCTIRGNQVRIISARKATRRERCQYGIQNEKRV